MQGTLEGTIKLWHHVQLGGMRGISTIATECCGGAQGEETLTDGRGSSSSGGGRNVPRRKGQAVRDQLAQSMGRRSGVGDTATGPWLAGGDECGTGRRACADSTTGAEKSTRKRPHRWNGHGGGREPGEGQTSPALNTRQP